MKKTITVFLFLLAGITMFAQDELRARMELKNAETAYSEGRYSDALEHLDKTQASLGKWSHQISYLRILSLDKLCNYDDMQSAYFQQLREEVKKYLDYNRTNADKAVMEKVEEVYAVEEHLNNELHAQEAWVKVDQTSQTDLRGYLASYPQSAKAGIAHNILNDMQKRENDLQPRDTWEQIKDTEDMAELERFIRDYAGTPEAQIAAGRFKLIRLVDMVFVQGGTFTMNNPPHQVTLSDFYIGRYEVTQALWELIMGSNPSINKGDNLPVVNVTWNAAQEFIDKLNDRTGKKYRLPTEAEWEYAARGGVKSKGYKYSGSNKANDVGWYNMSEGLIDSKEMREVGKKQPNELGIFDMSGNAYEWCSDWHGNLNSNPQVNPKGPDTGTQKVIRGGSSRYPTSTLRVSFRKNSMLPFSEINISD
ncbi:MAG: formylglycine-generating enzyme family protein, partial [Bacteroidales bacterium]|nr:formylglycine-generating enzyme family protein [Bacteroidales bacterium]